MKQYVQTSDRSEAEKQCPWAKYISESTAGYWCFDSYESWSDYEFNV